MTSNSSKGINKNARPFVPSGSASSYFSRKGSGSGPNPHTYQDYYNYSYLLNISSLPTSISRTSLVELIDSIIDANYETDENTAYTVVSFVHPDDDKPDPEDPEEETDKDPEKEESASAVVQVYDWVLCTKITENLNGFEWLGKILDVRLLSSPLMEAGSRRPSGPYFNNYNPYFPQVPPPQQSQQYHRSVSVLDQPPSSGSSPILGPSLPPSVPSVPPVPLGQSQEASKLQAYDFAGTIPHYSPQPPGFAQLPQYPLPPHPLAMGGPPPPANNFQPRYLTRRSSSNRSFESRKSRSNSSSSGMTSHKTSVSSVSSVSSATGAAKPVPSFIMNMVKNRSVSPQEEIPDEDEDPVAAASTEEVKPEEPLDNEPDPKIDEKFILIKSEEDNEEWIRVNPCRLFIGNVPYSSTWAQLKSFFVNRSKELDPTSNISILRVEIPMQYSSSNTPGSPGSDASDPNADPLLMTPQYAKSRGFAIVTTGNRQSSDRLIQLFDNADFEGRSLTVRYDKFPEYHNYVLQQLYPSSNPRLGPFQGINNNSNQVKGFNNNGRTNNYHGTSVISHLAFERNSFQQKFYYGGNNPMSAPTGPGGYLLYPYYYANNNPSGMPPNSVPGGNYNGNPIPSTLPPIPQQFYPPQYSIPPAQIYRNSQSGESRVKHNGENDRRPSSQSEKQPPSTPKSVNEVTKDFALNKSTFNEVDSALDEEQRARELVNSFGEFDITSK